jgi:hypothetical protein
MKKNLYNLFFQIKAYFLICLLVVLEFAHAQTAPSFFPRRGYVISYAPSFFDAHIKENVGIGIVPTRGYQAWLSRYMRTGEHWGIEVGLGMGYHVLDANINFSKTQYPKLPFDLKNGCSHTEEYFFQLPISLHYYQNLSPRLSLD